MTVEWSKTADGDKTIDGRYQRFKKSLGKGSFKHVYEAFDKQEQKDVAWNAVDLSQVRSESELDKIKKETNILKSLQHRNILRIHDTWINEKRDKLIFITDIMRDGSLLEYIMNRDITLGRVKEFSKEILNALEYLHLGVGYPPKPVIHRDLKCDNIFIDASINRIVLGDLGLSTSVGSSKTTAGQSVVGTPEFMAPEMFEEKYNEKVDIYAFGMCLIQMVTKKYPYQECRTLHQVYKKITKNKWPKVMSSIKSKSVRDFIQICCAFKHEKRPTAGMLRHHPFLSYSYPIDQLSCSNELIVSRSKLPPAEIFEKPTKPVQQTKSNRLARIDETESQAFGANLDLSQNVWIQPAVVKKQPDDRISLSSAEDKAPQQFTYGAKSQTQNLITDWKAQVSKAEEYEGAGQLRIMLNVVCKTEGHLDNRSNLIIKSVSFDYKRGEDTPRSIAKEMVDDLGLTPKKEMLAAIEEAMAEEHINAIKKFIPSSMASVNDPLPKQADDTAHFKNDEFVQPANSSAMGSKQLTHAMPQTCNKAVYAEVSTSHSSSSGFRSPKATFPTSSRLNSIQSGAVNKPQNHNSSHNVAGARSHGRPRNYPFTEYHASVSGPRESSLELRDICNTLKDVVVDECKFCTMHYAQACTKEVIPAKICQCDDSMQTKPGPIRISSTCVELPISLKGNTSKEAKIAALDGTMKNVPHTEQTTTPINVASETQAKLIILEPKKEQEPEINARILTSKRVPIAAKISTKEKIELQIQEEKKKLNDASLVGKDADWAKPSAGSLSKSLVKSTASKAFREEEPLSPYVSKPNRRAVSARRSPPVKSDENRGKSNLEDCNWAPVKTVNKAAHHRVDDRMPKDIVPGGGINRKAKIDRQLAGETPSMETSPDLLDDQNVDGISKESPTSLTDKQPRMFPCHQNVEAVQDPTVLGSGDESQCGRTSPGGQSSLITESKQPANFDSVAEFNIRAHDHLQNINKKLDEKRKKVMIEYRERLDEIDDYMDFRYNNLKKKTKDPELQKKIEGLMSEFKQQFKLMKVQSENFEKNCGLVMPLHVRV